MRKSVVGTAWCLGSLLVGACMAAVNASAADASRNGESAQTLEEVVVTGTRIRRAVGDFIRRRAAGILHSEGGQTSPRMGRESSAR